MKKKMVKHSRPLIAAADMLAVGISYYLAFLLRFDFRIPAGEMYNFLGTLPIVLVLRLTAFYYFGLYNGIWRYASLADLTAILKAVLVSQIPIVAIVLFIQHGHFPRSVLIISPLIAVLLVGGIRFSIRMTRSWRYGWNADKLPRMLIFGAGDLGEVVLREFERADVPTHRAVCFLDDNHAKHGRHIHGVPILGGRECLADSIRNMNIDVVLVAVGHSRGKIISDLMSIYSGSGYGRKVEFKTIPTMDEMINKKRHASDIRKIEISDLLHRKSVDIDMGAVRQLFRGKTVLITGAGGTIGSELCRQVMSFSPLKVLILENHNTALFYINKELCEKGYAGNVVPVAGDVRDESLLKNLFEAYRPQIVLHAAAHKHVSLMEDNPQEAVKNNTLGTYVLAKTAAAYGAERFLFISTDKAVRPSSVMGASKRLGEMIIRAMSAGTTKFMSVRFGNVLGSSGSVVKIFQEQITNGGPVTVRHPEVTRYFMTTEEAVQLILQACSMGNGGEIFVLNMGNPVKISELARNLIVLNGFEPDKDIKITFTELQPGEKMFEELFRSKDIRRDTGHPDVFMAVPEEADAALIDKQMGELNHLAVSPDKAAILRKIKELIPSYTGWPRSVHSDPVPGNFLDNEDRKC